METDKIGTIQQLLYDLFQLRDGGFSTTAKASEIIDLLNKYQDDAAVTSHRYQWRAKSKKVASEKTYKQVLIMLRPMSMEKKSGMSSPTSPTDTSSMTVDPPATPAPLGEDEEKKVEAAPLPPIDIIDSPVATPPTPLNSPVIPAVPIQADVIPGIVFEPIVNQYFDPNIVPIRNEVTNIKDFKLADLTLQQIENYSEVINSVSLEETRWIQTFDTDGIANTSPATLASYEKEYAHDGIYPILEVGFRDEEQNRFEDWNGYQKQIWDERYLGSIQLNGELKYREPELEIGDRVDVIESSNAVNIISEFRPRDAVPSDDWWLG